MSAYGMLFICLCAIASIHSANSDENVNGTTWKGGNDHNGQVNL